MVPVKVWAQVDGRLPDGVPRGVRVGGAGVPAKVPAMPQAGYAGMIGCGCARKSAGENNMWLCAFGPHAVDFLVPYFVFMEAMVSCLIHAENISHVGSLCFSIPVLPSCRQG